MGNADDAGQRTRVRPARDEDVPALVEVMVAAFADDPVHHWLYPDAGTRPDAHRRLFAFLLRCGLRHGGVWTDTGLRGMALWVAPGEQEMTDDETDVYLRMRREDMGSGPVQWARRCGPSARAPPRSRSRSSTSWLSTPTTRARALARPWRPRCWIGVMPTAPAPGSSRAARETSASTDGSASATAARCSWLVGHRCGRCSGLHRPDLRASAGHRDCADDPNPRRS